MQIRDAAVLITGASRGLGRELALSLARRGARLALVARDETRLNQVVAEARALGALAHGLAFDVGEKEFIHPLVGRAQALIGPIDIVIHNASTLGPTPLALLADTECEEFLRALEVNVLGPFRLSKALAMGMVVRGRGLLVHISSDAAVSAYPRWGAYGVSKAALDHLSRIWAAELEGSGVRSLSVDPGEMDTDMHRAAMPDADVSNLSRPRDVAERIVRLMEREGEAPVRVSSEQLEVHS